MTVTLYGISFMDRNGLRTLLGPAQGRYMYNTAEIAQEKLAAFMANSAGRLIDVCGEQSRDTFRVDAFECYAGHHDPKSIYVDEP